MIVLRAMSVAPRSLLRVQSAWSVPGASATHLHLFGICDFVGALLTIHLSRQQVHVSRIPGCFWKKCHIFLRVDVWIFELIHVPLSLCLTFTSLHVRGPVFATISTSPRVRQSLVGVCASPEVCRPLHMDIISACCVETMIFPAWKRGTCRSLLPRT